MTGEWRAFCVGADLKEHNDGARTSLQRRQYLELANAVCARLYGAEKPVIAAVNGFAIGAGAEMAVSCDFIVMKDTAEIGFPELGLGTFIGGGVSHLLPRDLLIKLLRFADAHTEITEIDLNPVIVRSDGYTIVDARMIIGE